MSDTEPNEPGEAQSERGAADSPPRDRREENEKAWHEWLGIAVALTALLSVAALVIGIAALGSSGTSGDTVAAAAPAAPAAPAAGPVKTEVLGMAIKADAERGRRGPDGQWHDAFLPAELTVHAGDKVTITFTNYDAGPHSFVSPSLGVDQIINGGGSLGAPQTVTLTFVAPTRPGRYAWWCGVPCDPWAMQHDGYMRGFVTVQA